ncbi:IQ motif-containing protein H isoform X2 [Osmia lignaria lignaria]|uniref:IQ motif-containing protein H isoform X2 n=1 Tax=Osmia lignaria lignaria TaxID=1437193 RepID=UPI0014786C00|nr:IQ motif-containing protein H-like isoform X2 [Osmia lignaria]
MIWSTLGRKCSLYQKNELTRRSGNEIISESIDSYEDRSAVKLSLHPKGIMKLLNRKEVVHHSVLEELSKVGSLKFVDGHHKNSNVWLKILDVYGNQYGSRWNLIVRPQIERIIKKRQIPVLHLKPRETFNFLSSIKGNETDIVLERQDLIDLLENKTEATWLESWELQFRTIEGEHIAATLIQARWRGYVLRKMKRESDRLYIAASYLWFTWMNLKQKKEIHKRYLEQMLISLQTTRELSLKLSKEFDSMILQPHVVIHLPSIGNPLEVRQSFDPITFRIVQNISSLRISMVRNPKTEIIYILPVKPTEDLLMMYSDFIESMSPSEDDAKRITFIALSQLETFKHRPINTSRILHCSEDTLEEIRKKIAGKSAYFLPWHVDECDMRLAGSLGIPLLSPDMELQRTMLNSSKVAEMIEKFGLLQPIHARDIKDYKTLCSTMADFIVRHTEVCIWLIKLNYAILDKHSGIFLINHISVPFMPLLRKEREKHGDAWMESPSLREEFHQKLMVHLPKVVSYVTRLMKSYKSWKEFYMQIQKYGCLLQAIPMEKDSNTISVSLFLSGRATGKQPRWIGTADKLNLGLEAISTFMYMMPQSSLDIKKLESSVNKFAMGMQDEGYFGYLTVDCYCYTNKFDDKFVVLMQNVRPCYSFVQSYIDWMKFAIGGAYNSQTNQFIADVPVIPDSQRRKSSILYPHKSPEWNETKERCGVIIGLLYDTRLSGYRWSQLRNIFAQCNITFDAKKKQGSSIILHDDESRNFGLMMAASPSMAVTLSTLHDRLAKINVALATKSKRKYESNLPSLIDFFGRLAVDYENLALDECIPAI